MRLKKILNILVCPDCEGKLVFNKKFTITCGDCERKFYSESNFVDLLPKKPKEIANPYSKGAVKYYLKQFRTDPKKIYRKFNVWGTYETSRRGYKVFLENELKVFEKFYPKQREIFCDISAASGFYTFNAAKKFDIVLHLDINMQYLRFAMKKALEKKVDNIVFIRSDYFSLPIKHKALDTLLCTDSLEYYGLENDIKIMERALNTLKTKGRFILDLHNRKFYYPDPKIFEYGKKELIILKKRFRNIQVIPFGRVPTLLHPSQFLFDISSKLSFMPPVRNILVISPLAR